MKNLPLLLVVVATMLSQGAQAQSCNCSGSGATQVTNTGASLNLTDTLTGSTVCVTKSGGGWEWQEQHRAGGQLWDYKLGTSTMDPTKQVGSWAVSGNGANSVVKHTYGAQTFEYKVCRVGTTTNYGFCPTAGGATIMSTIKVNTISGCP